MNLRMRFILTVAAVAPFPALAQQGFDQSPSQYQPAQQAPQGAYPANYPSAAPQAGGYNQMPPQGNNMLQQDPGYAQPSMPDARGNPMSGYRGGQPGGGMGNGMNPMQNELAAELQDFGVTPQAQLQTQMHAPTPTSIPGGQVITTDRLLMLYQQGQQNGLLVFDVLGSGFTLPMAQNALGAAQPGSFNDQVQRDFGQYLQQVTQGNKARPMLFYCQGAHCWMSYNAALRAIRLGFTQVYWYRGGVEAWQRVQQMASSQPQQPGGAMAGGYQQAPAGYSQGGQNPYTGRR